MSRVSPLSYILYNLKILVIGGDKYHFVCPGEEEDVHVEEGQEGGQGGQQRQGFRSLDRLQSDCHRGVHPRGLELGKGFL